MKQTPKNKINSTSTPKLSISREEENEKSSGATF